MQLFFNPNLTPETKEISFTKEESTHIVKVLRQKEGATIYVTNGKGYLFKSIIISDNPKNCIAQVLQVTYTNPLPYQLHLAVAPTKSNDRFEWFLEKATEIGVHTITPIICEHSERKNIKTERFHKIIEGAVKQSLQTYKPILNEATPFSAFIEKCKDLPFEKYIAFCEDSSSKTIINNLQPHKNIIVLIGPEGDFSTPEINMALKNNWYALSLGNTRLRTETAAIYVCNSLSFVNLSL